MAGVALARPEMAGHVSDINVGNISGEGKERVKYMTSGERRNLAKQAIALALQNVELQEPLRRGLTDAEIEAVNKTIRKYAAEIIREERIE